MTVIVVLRALLRIVSVAATLWLVATLLLFAIMWLPPVQFASIIGKLPAGGATRMLPFQTLWGYARAGSLAVGDPAPDFDLERHDKSGRVKLSSHFTNRPVVLVFGSYT